VGTDNLCPYYDVALKRDRLATLADRPEFRFVEADLADRGAMRAVFDLCGPRRVIHLGAQAGVRYSLSHPETYVDSNLVGFMTILEECRRLSIAHLVYASSSSVYGGNEKLPFAVSDSVDHPVSLYAATKKANELMAHSYAHLFGLPATGLRFFTVYGPWGRPDMAYWKFAEAIIEDRPIDVFNEGRMARDFTYVDDAADAVVRVAARAPAPDPDFDAMRPDPGSSWAPHRVHNVGNTRRENLLDMIAMLETALGREARKRFLPMQPGDVVETWADVSSLEREIGYAPATPLAEGLGRFAAWFVDWRARR
uniref:NAD-dependent epimerase/dehydratase family protein n=1 Tax=Rubrimonas sp. TaxID=2036015 RepID=UPI002FDEFAD1